MAVNMHDRWVYKGSVTTPPCGQSVYWNVLKTIHPIKSEHLYQFKKQLEKRGEDNLVKTGNWREIQKVDNHNVLVVSTAAAKSNSTVNVLGIILFVLVGVAIVLMATLYMNVYKKKEYKTDI